MLDVAVVGLGAWGLCVLERAIRCARTTQASIRVHAIEPGEVGGAQYSQALPDYLVLNNACGQLSLYASADEDVTPRYGLSLYEWARRRNYGWRDDSCVTSGWTRPVAPGDYLPRRLMGEYLAWFYQAALEELPRNIEIVRYRAAAVDVLAYAGDREQIRLDDGRSLVVDHVVLTSGHTPNVVPDRRPGEVVPMSAYPINALTAAPAAGEHVAVSGMGLVAYDVIAAMTTGRGGRFTNRGDRKTYQPSGREPLVSLFSRSGIPYCAKSASGIDPTGDYRPVVCTADAFAALRASGDVRTSRRAVDLRTELLPLLFAEMSARYYVHAATTHDGSEAAVGVRSRLATAWALGTFEDAATVLARRYGAFYPQDHVFAGEDRSYASSQDYEKQFYAMVENDLDEALAPAGSPVKAAQEVLRILRDEIRSIIEFGGLTHESYVDFKTNVKGRVNRLEAGPPALRSQQLLALIDAGIVQVPFGPGPSVAAGPSGQVIITSAQLDVPYSAEVTAVVGGHLDMPSLANSASPLLSRLYRLGRLTQLHYGGTAVGSVAISEDFHPFDVEGRLQRNISVLGVLTEGSRYFTHYIPSPRSRIRAVRDAQACIESLIRAA